MGIGDKAPPVGYSSFDVSKRLHELSGWPGDTEWADWLPITEENYPGYTCGYLFRQLEGIVEGFYIRLDPNELSHFRIVYWDTAMRLADPLEDPRAPRSVSSSPRSFLMTDPRFFTRKFTRQFTPTIEVLGETAEDALTQFCIELWERGLFSADKSQY